MRFSALQAGTKKIFQVRFYSDREIPDEMALAFRVKKAQNAILWIMELEPHTGCGAE